MAFGDLRGMAFACCVAGAIFSKRASYVVFSAAFCAGAFYLLVAGATFCEVFLWWCGRVFVVAFLWWRGCVFGVVFL